MKTGEDGGNLVRFVPQPVFKGLWCVRPEDALEPILQSAPNNDILLPQIRSVGTNHEYYCKTELRVS